MQRLNSLNTDLVHVDSGGAEAGYPGGGGERVLGGAPGLGVPVQLLHVAQRVAVERRHAAVRQHAAVHRGHAEPGAARTTL